MATDAFGSRRIGPIVVALASAASIFWLGYDGGGYSVTSYTSSGIAVLWALLIGAAGGLLPAIRAARQPVTVALRIY